MAIPAASLCINRRLYKIATIKTVTVTTSEKRRAVMIDLLIGIGIPILQMIARECTWSVSSTGYSQGCNSEYMISFHRFTIFEDFGPVFSNALVVESIFLFAAWPVAIGCVSFVYCGGCLGLPSLGAVAH